MKEKEIMTKTNVFTQQWVKKMGVAYMTESYQKTLNEKEPILTAIAIHKKGCCLDSCVDLTYIQNLPKWICLECHFIVI